MTRPTMTRRAAFLTLTAALGLAGCGRIRDSRLNPFNWFGRSEEAEKVALPEAPRDPRALVQTVLSLVVEETAGGAIVRATGLPPTQGWWDAELVAQPVDENGRLVLDFRIFPPIETKRAGTQPSREVVVALFLSNIKLDPVREIIVQGETNARAARR
jgi:hypothetical protein